MSECDVTLQQFIARDGKVVRGVLAFARVMQDPSIAKHLVWMMSTNDSAQGVIAHCVSHEIDNTSTRGRRVVDEDTTRGGRVIAGINGSQDRRSSS